MMSPRISIVTPSYNQARYLPETIESILSQGYPNLEYIIIDGGSTDGSEEIIKRYERHLAYWVSEKDSGQSEAINKGLQRPPATCSTGSTRMTSCSPGRSTASHVPSPDTLTPT